MKIYDKKSYYLLVGNNSCDIFKYFRVNEMHGLSYNDCLSYDRNGHYICGFTNYNPHNMSLKPFLFINTECLHNDYRDVTLLTHELTHMALLLYNWDIEYHEEEIVSWVEIQANEILSKSLIPSYQVPGIITPK